MENGNGMFYSGYGFNYLTPKKIGKTNLQQYCRGPKAPRAEEEEEEEEEDSAAAAVLNNWGKIFFPNCLEAAAIIFEL